LRSTYDLKDFLRRTLKWKNLDFLKENKETVNGPKYFYFSNKVHTTKSGIHIKVTRIVAVHE